ncbi:PP2C-like domain-containing protein CG9801 [Mercenaria mercenaria]|uniref:PP2C-like domain-containing protein CG9801 n=1 Tax=Mercenaria mercenaria TaxID=6596 RepID=UPI00234E4110|nr:PP2C-like domain-containing protein CG9801 [Mercenaria mercenaria]
MLSIHFGSEVYSSQHGDDLPLVELAPLSDEIFASYSGPDDGLAFGLDNRAKNSDGEIAGSQRWNMKAQKAYGICISLYEQHPVSGKMSGDPVADAFAICARGNNCIMLIADGVNWGEKSRLAARCALYGSMEYINHRIFNLRRHPTSTHDVFLILRKSFDKAHLEIMEREGGLTTLCACMICPVKKSGQFAVCTLNVGDSYGYIFSHNQGIREVTQGSHDVSLVRDIRDAGGAIGPVDGKNPELHNLTYGLSFGNQGDIVFLTTDGISDNYDPVVTKIAVARVDHIKSKSEKESENSDDDIATSSASCINGKPEMEPKERHIYAMKEMERIVYEHELVTEEQTSAQDLCSALVQHVLLLTDQKRKVLENPDLYKRKRLSQKDKQRRDSEIVSKMSEAPGKLDHASIVSYEIGQWKPDEDEMDCIPLEGQQTSGSDTSSHHSSHIDSPHVKSPTSPSSHSHVTSPSTSSKKIRPKKLFNKLRNNLSMGSSPNSPSTEQCPGGSQIITAKRFSFKRSRTKSEPAAVTPTSPVQPSDFRSPPFEDFRYARSPISPTPMSPGTPTGGLPLPAQYPYRKSIAFESAV